MTQHERKIFGLVEQELQKFFDTIECKCPTRGTKPRKQNVFKLDKEVYLNARARCNL